MDYQTFSFLTTLVVMMIVAALIFVIEKAVGYEKESVAKTLPRKVWDWFKSGVWFFAACLAAAVVGRLFGALGLLTVLGSYLVYCAYVRRAKRKAREL